MPQTTNPIEGWYNKFQAIYTSYHPKLPQKKKNKNKKNQRQQQQQKT